MKIAIAIIAALFVFLLILVASALAAAAQEKMCEDCKHRLLCDEMERKNDKDFVPPCYLERMKRIEQVPNQPTRTP